MALTFDIHEVQTLAQEAGRVIMPHFKSELNVLHKHDGSPVTAADQASEDLILTGLSRLTPDIPIIAEELSEAGLSPSVQGQSCFWLVDPLDGTKEFIKGSPDFTVNIGLIQNGRPVFGVVYLPATGDLYYGGKGLGAFLNGKPITTARYNPEEGLTMVGKSVHPDPRRQRLRERYLRGHQIASYTIRGSSLKFCLVADGSAHIYPRLIPTYEWDTAAAHAMLLETGGDIWNIRTGERLQYGKPRFRNGHLITGTVEVLEMLRPE